MSPDKYPGIFSRQMEAIVYIFTLVSRDKMSHIICVYSKFGRTGFLK